MMISGIGKQRALTFIELLFVIVIIGILIGVSIPNFRDTFNSLQLNNTSGQLQALMNYLHQRSIVEQEIFYLNIDNDKKEFRVFLKEGPKKIKTIHFPNEIILEATSKDVVFYPDGNIDKVVIKLSNRDNQNIILTTEGVLGGVKVCKE